jgi:hypothetical protein
VWRGAVREEGGSRGGAVHEEGGCRGGRFTRRAVHEPPLQRVNL